MPRILPQSQKQSLPELDATTKASKEEFQSSNRHLFLSTNSIGDLNPHTDKEWRPSDHESSLSDDSGDDDRSDDSVQLVCVLKVLRYDHIFKTSILD